MLREFSSASNAWFSWISPHFDWISTFQKINFASFWCDFIEFRYLKIIIIYLYAHWIQFNLNSSKFIEFQIRLKSSSQPWFSSRNMWNSHISKSSARANKMSLDTWTRTAETALKKSPIFLKGKITCPSTVQRLQD